MEKNKKDKLFGFTREQILEATRVYQKMDQKEAKNLLLNNPLARVFMEDLSVINKEKQDD